ncbi:MAG: substrate-binding domain-containing protein [Pseudomonadota bacterium]
MLTKAADTVAGSRRKPRVTISDLAETLGVTKGTVSRALNGYPDISERTRKRVVRAAEAKGYIPLAHAQAIRTGRVRSIGLVLQISEHDAHGPFLTDFLAGLTMTASTENWTLAVATANSDDHMLETIGRMVSERKADGFILPRTLTNDPRIGFLREEGVPFVLYGRTGDDSGCAWFDILGEDAMQGAVTRLVGQGHRRIGFVNGGQEYNFCGLRQAGYERGLEAAGLVVDRTLIRTNSRLSMDGTAATLSLMRLSQPPTAIVYATDEAALGAYRAADTLGLTIGQDLSIIAYDGIPEGAYAQPPLTTFSVDTRAAGVRLAALLIRLIRGEAPEALREFAHAHLVARGSDGPPALSSTALAKRIAAHTGQTSKGGHQ